MARVHLPLRRDLHLTPVARVEDRHSLYAGTVTESPDDTITRDPTNDCREVRHGCLTLAPQPHTLAPPLLPGRVRSWNWRTWLRCRRCPEGLAVDLADGTVVPWGKVMLRDVLPGLHSCRMSPSTVTRNLPSDCSRPSTPAGNRCRPGAPPLPHAHGGYALRSLVRTVEGVS